eukprot:4324399-Amphidinium_carterae.1
MATRFRLSVKVRHLRRAPWQMAARYMHTATSSLGDKDRISLAVDAARTGGKMRMLGFTTSGESGWWCPPL